MASSARRSSSSRPIGSAAALFISRVPAWTGGLRDLRDRALQLAERERALEPRRDAARLGDDERPRLGLQPPGRHRPLDVALGDAVVLPDLLVDERDALRRLRLRLLDDVDDGAAHAALAQRRRGERDDDRLLADDIR